MTIAERERVGRFFDRARDTALAGDELRFDAEEMLAIARRRVTTNEFSARFAALNDPEVRAAILDFVKEQMQTREDLEAEAQSHLDIFDRATFPVATTLVGSGVGGLIAAGVASTFALAGLVLLSGGVAVMAASVVGRMFLHRRLRRLKAERRYVERLAEALNV